MSIMEYIYPIATLISAIAAVLAWVAKLRWSKEFSSAKEEIIKSKNAQIEMLKQEIQNLRELNPMKMREYLLSVKETLEDYNNDLLQQLSEEKARLAVVENTLEMEKQKSEGMFIELEAEKDKLMKEINNTEIAEKTFKEYAQAFKPEKFKESYGSVGSWYKLFKAQSSKNTDVDALNKLRESLSPSDRKHLEAEAWEDFLDLCVEQTGIWVNENKDS